MSMIGGTSAPGVWPPHWQWQSPSTCSHGVANALPCAACGRGYPSSPSITVVGISDGDVDRIARRIVELLKADAG